MTNIFTKNLDINDYFNNGELIKIAEISKNLSENSKLAEISTDRLNNNDYALILISDKGREFPKYAMNSPSLTELNMAFLETNLDKLPEELVKKAARNLTAAANYYKIDIPDRLLPYNDEEYTDRYLSVLDIDESSFLKKIANKPVKPTQQFALKGKYPLENLEKTSSWFDRNYTKLDIDEQLEFIENTNKVFDSNSIVKLGGYINKISNLDKDSFNPNLSYHLNIRKSYVEDGTDKAEIFDDLWNRKDEIGPLKTAYVLENIDREYQLNDIYGLKIATPLQSVLDELKKEAEVDGITFEALKKLDNKKLAGIVGFHKVANLLNDSSLQNLSLLPNIMKIKIKELIPND